MILLLSLACQSPKLTDSSTLEDTANEDSLGRFPGQYLMAMFACDGNICMDPTAFNHEVWIMYSDDGQQWKLPEENEPFEGSVPDLVRRGDTLYVYGGRRTLRRYHFDTDTWEDPVDHEQTGEEIRWNDFSPMIGDDGLIHLFFLASLVENGDPAECPTSSTEQCTQRFGSAIEVEGSDGALFEIQEGMRLEIPLQPGERCSDPDVFQMADGRWAMYITWREGTALFTSDELHGTYEPAAELGSPPYIAPPFLGLGVGHYNPLTEQYWTYINYPEEINGGPEVNIVIQRAIHDSLDFTLQENDFETVISGGDTSGLPLGYWAASPGFTLNTP